jgi:hypothetical protein
MSQEAMWQFLVDGQIENSECAHCGTDNHAWNFCQEPVMASSSQGNRLKPKDDNPNDVLSMAGAAGRKPTTQFSAPRCDYKVDSNNQIIID